MTPIIFFVCVARALPRVTGGALRAAAVLLVGMAALGGAVTVSAEHHHPPVATLVKNLDQPSGPDIRLVLSKNQDGLMQGFRTGPFQGGYELESIWLYVRDTWESRYMTIDAGLYRDFRTRPRKVATLTRGQMNDYAHNEWKAPANTYLEPNTDYWFMLDCVSGCANDNVAQFGTTYSAGEDGGGEPGWSIRDRALFRRPGENWIRDNDEALRIRVRGRPSPYRAYRTEIVSTPRDHGTYHYGEHIDVALTFNTAVYVPARGSVIAIRVGDTADGSNYRAAEYYSGSQTNRLVYRYQVQLADTDTDGVSVDVGGPNSGFGGTVPTIVASFGLLPVIDHYPGLTDDHHHRVDGSFHVHDVAVTSTPAHADSYRVGENIDVTLTFSTEAYASADSVIAIQVGDVGPSYRRAAYVSGSGTTRLTYRYEVQLTDLDADGIGIPSSGFVRELPTTSPALGSVPVSRDYTGVAEDAGHRVDGSFRVTGVAITSSPAHGDRYRAGENIEVTMNFSTEAYTSGSVVAIRVGDTDDGSNYRPARYVSGSGTDALIYRYQAQLTDFDADGISVDVGGPPSGFGERVPTSSPELGSVPVARKYAGVPDDAGHKVDGAVTVAFGSPAYVVSEDGITADVTVALDADPHREVVIPITATPGGGATASDYAVAPASLVFAPGETRHSVTVTAIDDSDVDDGESLRLSFGTLPPGVRAGSQDSAFVVIDDNDGFDPIVSIADVDGGSEAGSVGFTVTLSGPSDLDITVDWGISDSAAGPDAGNVATGTLTITAGETTGTVSVTVGDDAADPPDGTFSVTLSNPVNAVFSGGVDTIEAELLVWAPSINVPSAPVVTAVPDTAGNLIVSWAPPADAVPSGYEVEYRVRGTESREPRLSAGPETQVPILFLDQDTEYEARVRPFYDDADDGGARSYAPWSELGYGRTGTHQQDSKPVVTLALADSDSAIEGEDVLLHIVVSELRNSYQWHGYSDGIGVGLKFGWRKGGNILSASSQFGIVPGVFTVDHGLGGHRDYRESLPDYAAEHGPLTITLQPGDGYQVGEAGSVCVSIADSETLDATPCPDAEDTDAPDSQAGDAPVSIAAQDARAIEGVDEIISFEVTLSAAASEPVTVDWATADGTATAGVDYVASSGTLTFAAGETAQTIEVTVLDDAHDEGEETFALRLSGAAGAELADAEATGTIANSDPMPRAWLGRFGRTAWEHTLGAVDQRLRSARTPVARAAVAGREISATGANTAGAGDEQGSAALAAWFGSGSDQPQAELSGRELLAGSEFQAATAVGDGDGDSERDGVVTIWGQGAYGRFAGQDGDLAVDGDVASGTLGVDYATGPWMVGLALSHSSGWGSYAQPMAPGGEVTSSLTGAYPYVGVEAVAERLSLWLAGGYGLGGLRLVPRGGEALETEIGMLAGAVGVRATLLPAAATGGLALGLNADALVLRATSEEAPGLAAATADVNRVRLGLEGMYAVALGGGAHLTPSVEVGVRRDGGTADTGYGIDAVGGLRYTNARLGLSLGLTGRALLLHETAELAEWGASGWLAWDPNPASELGPALTVSPSIGAQSEGGARELWSRETLIGLAGDPMDANGGGRVDAKFGYGMPLAGGVGVPWAGIGASEHAREYRLGYAFQAGDPSATDLRVELVAARREPANAPPEHTLAVHSTVRW